MSVPFHMTHTPEKQYFSFFLTVVQFGIQQSRLKKNFIIIIISHPQFTAL